MSRLEDVLARIIEDKMHRRGSIVDLACGCQIHLFAPYRESGTFRQGSWIFAASEAYPLPCGHIRGIQTPEWVEDFIANLKEKDLKQ